MNQSAAALVPLIVPLAYAAAALLPSRMRPAPAVTAAAPALALVSVAWLVAAGPAVARGPLVSLGPFGTVAPSVRLDVPAAVMLMLVTFVAAVILRFAARAMDREAGRAAFESRFLATMACASMLVVTNDLLVMALAWTGSSLALHGLLTFFRDRPQSLMAAHEKFILSRVADACILTATGLVGWSLGTLEIDRMIERVASMAHVPAALQAAGLLLVAGVVLRSAQLPFHGWLVRVMEAPTPVSALLHAGIVNIGGFVMIRLAPMMVRLDLAQALLVVAGTASAVVAALVMMTRTSVKASLAWSTVAQMGFMLVECGLGAHGLALLHLVAHSLYKAHAFLASGGAVEQARLRSMLPPAPAAGLGARLASGAAGVAVVAALAAAAGLRPAGHPGMAALGVIAGLAVGPVLLRAVQARSLRGVAAPLAAAAFVLALLAAGHATAGALLPPSGAVSPVLEGLVACGFILLFVVQSVVAARPARRLARELYPACLQGFHLDDVFARLTFEIWPLRAQPAVRAIPPRRHDAGMPRAA